MKKLIAVIIAAAVLAGCSANELNANASRVRVTNQEPKDCQFVGTVTGHQGNAFTGFYTSNTNLEQGAMNTIRNEAANLGADTLVILTQRAGVTGNWSNQQETNVIITGSAYKCPNPQ